MVNMSYGSQTDGANIKLHLRTSFINAPGSLQQGYLCCYCCNHDNEDPPMSSKVLTLTHITILSSGYESHHRYHCHRGGFVHVTIATEGQPIFPQG